jgi:hypothetical protein
MPDTRVIHTGIFHDGNIITDADELEKAFSKEQLAQFTVSGAISGFDAKADKAAAKEVESKESDTAPQGKKK